MVLDFDILVFILLSILFLIGFIVFIGIFFKIFSYKKEKNINKKKIIFLIYIITISICMFIIIFGNIMALRRSKFFLNNLWYENKASTKMFTQNLLVETNQIENIVKNLAFDPNILNFFYDSSKIYYEKMNLTLDRYKNFFNFSVCYILDNKGKVIGYSNRNDVDNLLNKDFNSYIYFEDVMQGLSGKSISKDIKANIWDFYASYPIKNQNNKIIGAAVIKKKLMDFENLFLNYNRIIFFINQTGNIYISNNKKYQFKNIYNSMIYSKNSKYNSFNKFHDMILESKKEIINPYIIDKLPVIYYAQELGFESWTIVSFLVISNVYNVRFTILTVFFLIEMITLIISIFFIFIYNKTGTENLIESEKKFIDIFDYAPMGVFLTSYDNKLSFIGNQKADEIFNSILNKRTTETNIFNVFTEESILPHFNKTAKEKIIETQCKTKINLPINKYLLISRNLEFQKNSCRLFFIKDINEISKIEKKLVESQDRFREFAEIMKEIIFETDIFGKLQYVNQKAIEAFRYTRAEFLKGVNISEAIDEKDLDRALADFKKVMNGKKIENTEYLLKRKDGSVFPAYIRTTSYLKDDRVAGIRGIIIDITSQKRIEEDMLKIGKVEAMGNLAGGIAHDFNNILTIIQNSISLLKIELEEENLRDELIKIFSDINITLGQAKKLSGQLLAFSKGDAPIKKNSNLKDLIIETTDFILSGSSIVAEYNIENNLMAMEFDEEQIRQVLQNILINAVQSINNSGTIQIFLKNEVIKVKPIKNENQNYAVITIKDSGCGITQEILPHIYDPFFTTKKDSNGLGLSIAQRIILKHDGWISVESQVNIGTTFKIFLPAYLKTDLKKEKKEKKENIIHRGTGRILFMDDEELLRILAKKLIRHLGYEVELVSGGNEAIRLYREFNEKNEPFDCLILDLTIQGDKGGLEVLEEIKKFDPDVKAIVSSGYSENPVIGNFKKYGFSGVITKPYSIENLSTAIKEVLKLKKK